MLLWKKITIVKEEGIDMKFYKVLMIVCTVFFAVLKASAAPGVSEVLYSAIEEEVDLAQLELSNNRLSTELEIVGLKTKLNEMWRCIKEKGFVEEIGGDFKLRPAYITMQGIIERALIKISKEEKVKEIGGWIVTPRMPTPLMLNSSSGLSEIDLRDPLGFVRYRNAILIDFLETGSVLEVIYSQNARSYLSDERLSDEGLSLIQYESYRNRYPNLIDLPVIRRDIAEFPGAMTGAIYWVGDLSISIESRQLGQASDGLRTWAIKFGSYAKEREREVGGFLKEYL